MKFGVYSDFGDCNGEGGLGKSFGEMQMVFWGILVIQKVLNDSYMISKNYGLFGNF